MGRWDQQQSSFITQRIERNQRQTLIGNKWQQYTQMTAVL